MRHWKLLYCALAVTLASANALAGTVLVVATA